MPVIHAIRHYYGKGAAVIVGMATFSRACSFAWEYHRFGSRYEPHLRNELEAGLLLLYDGHYGVLFHQKGFIPRWKS